MRKAVLSLLLWYVLEVIIFTEGSILIDLVLLGYVQTGTLWFNLVSPIGYYFLLMGIKSK